jgi:hypothetical protein
VQIVFDSRVWPVSGRRVQAKEAYLEIEMAIPNPLYQCHEELIEI